LAPVPIFDHPPSAFICNEEWWWSKIGTGEDGGGWWGLGVGGWDWQDGWIDSGMRNRERREEKRRRRRRKEARRRREREKKVIDRDHVML
jgi:hypothetical protein